jgi:kinesin family protein 15
MPRSFEYIFNQIDEMKKKCDLKSPSKEGSQNSFEYLIRCSYLEIYNEQIMDLLDPSQQNLHIREDIKKGVYVEGLNEEVVNNSIDMLNLI